MTYANISARTGFTQCQIQQACTFPVTPYRGNSPGRPALRTPQRRRLTREFYSDPTFRVIPWLDMPFVLLPPFNLYGPDAITTAFRKEGFKRTTRPRRIYLSETHKVSRVQFAMEQLNLQPNPEDWESVIFSDETWATNMFRQWITLHANENREDYALMRRRPAGWMFAGMFAGAQKGPGLFWEKEWGGITAEKYQRWFLPLVEHFYHDSVTPPASIFQKDNAPAHAARSTQAAILNMGYH